MDMAPGVHRLEFAIGSKPMAMYIVAGDRLTLIDTGLPSTPAEVYLPAIERLGRSPEEVAWIVITHADADHIGGNDTARRLFPNARLLCHEDDQRWASDPAAIMAERYDGFAPYGLRYNQSVFDMLGSWMGSPVPMDLLVRGGERLRRTDDDWLTVVHVPGHTPGHLCLYNPRHRYAIAGDAIFGRSQLDTLGNWSAAPPYTTVQGYRTTIQTLRSLSIDTLFTCHYPVMRGAEVARFLDESDLFVDLAEEFTRELLRATEGPLTLGAVVAAADHRLGPFGFPDDLQFALLAHLDHAVAQGRARREMHDGIVTWQGGAQ